MEQITIKRFEKNLQNELAKAAFAVRRKVFIEEQQVDEKEEFDAFESDSVHYAALAGGQVVGTARYRRTEEGVKLERFAVLKPYRRKGVGNALLKALLDEIGEGQGKMYLHAQTAVTSFYEKHGFRKVGEQFEECNIQHYKMIAGRESGAHIELSLSAAIDHVRHFHDAFGIGNERKPKAMIREKDVNLRYQLMKEENEEYLEAAKKGDLVEIADALGDMLYILCGTILKHGLQKEFAAVFEEIQRSNMSKLDKEGKPIYREDGKVLKSDLYFKPDIARILKDHLES